MYPRYLLGMDVLATTMGLCDPPSQHLIVVSDSIFPNHCFPIRHGRSSRGLCLAPANADAAQTTDNSRAIRAGCTLARLWSGQSESLPVTLDQYSADHRDDHGYDHSGQSIQRHRIEDAGRASAGKAVTFNVIFTPTEKHSAGGTITFASNAWNKSLVLAVGGIGRGNR